MPVVSVSLGDDDIENLDRIQKEYGLKGRSDAVRTALRMATADLEGLKEMQGTVEGVLIVVRGDHADPWLNLIQVRHVGIVTTQLHSHLKDHRCLEVMILSGRADAVRAMILEVEGSGKAEYVRFVQR